MLIRSAQMTTGDLRYLLRDALQQVSSNLHFQTEVDVDTSTLKVTIVVTDIRGPYHCVKVFPIPNRIGLYQKTRLPTACNHAHLKFLAAAYSRDTSLQIHLKGWIPVKDVLDAPFLMTTNHQCECEGDTP